MLSAKRRQAQSPRCQRGSSTRQKDVCDGGLQIASCAHGDGQLAREIVAGGDTRYSITSKTSALQ